MDKKDAPPDSVALVKRILRGDLSAEEEFADRFNRGTYLLMLRRTGNPDTAWELTQDALLTALVTLRQGKLREPKKLPAFVHGIAKNVFLRHLRAKGRQNGIIPLTSDLHPDLELRTPPGADAVIHIREILQKLNPIDRRILEFTLVEGLSMEETAQRLGLNSALVRKRKSRALKKLSAIYERMSQK